MLRDTSIDSGQLAYVYALICSSFLTVAGACVGDVPIQFNSIQILPSSSYPNPRGTARLDKPRKDRMIGAELEEKKTKRTRWERATEWVRCDPSLS